MASSTTLSATANRSTFVATSAPLGRSFGTISSTTGRDGTQMWLTGQNTHSRVPDMWSANRAERVFAALSDGGRVLMPIQETFFASRFGQVRDRFGINWMI